MNGMSRDSFLMMDLVRALYWVDESLQLAMKERGWKNMSRSQSLILINIASGVHRASTLAANLGVSRQAISQMLAEMQAAGKIDVKPDPEDRRAQRVTFSKESAAERDDAMMILSNIEQELAKRIGKRRMTALREALSMDWGEIPRFNAAGEATVA